MLKNNFKMGGGGEGGQQYKVSNVLGATMIL